MRNKDHFTVIFIGLGSIGKRHLKILKQITNVKAFKIKSRHENLTIKNDNVEDIEIFESIDQAIKKKPNFAIIATPSAYHLFPASKLLDANIPFIIEKPVSHNLEGLDLIRKKAVEKKIPILVGFQFRYHPAFWKITEWIKDGKIGHPLCFIGEVGQYLPDWRPGIDYRKNYSAHKEMGGGVILDLCHEIDIALQIMGPVQKVSCLSGKYSNLDINSEDIAMISCEHKNRGVSNLVFNYIERGYTWKTRILGSKGTITWDYDRGIAELNMPYKPLIYYKDSPEFHRDDLFLNQMKHWLEVVCGYTNPSVTLEEGIEVVKICHAAYQSSKEGKHLIL